MMPHDRYLLFLNEQQQHFMVQLERGWTAWLQFVARYAAQYPFRTIEHCLLIILFLQACTDSSPVTRSGENSGDHLDCQPGKPAPA